MSPPFQEYETPRWRLFWLVLAFVVLTGVGIVTVLRPELQDEPDDETAGQAETGE
ncbi:MAG: hypothetical protein OEV36_04615 [Myxococcales bacterium]|nr:hypothetical protein [Myxococcales bacterium]